MALRPDAGAGALIARTDAARATKAGPIAILRRRIVVLLAVLAAAPFLVTPIPPLTDVPGHIAQFTVQTAAAGDGLRRYFTFTWGPTLNLASDLIVQMLHPLLGVVPLVWLLCAATPALTVIGIMALARVTNARGAYALPWALLFVFNIALLWGFLNFVLTQALALVAFAGWIALDARPRLRAVLSLAITPLLLVGHGVAGIAAIGMIVGHTVWGHGLHRPGGWTAKAVRACAAAWPPVVAGLITLIAWKAVAPVDGGATLWLLRRKSGAIVHMLQDQNKVFDIGCVAASLVVWLLGRRWGARLNGGAAGAVIAVVVLFFATPSLLSGSDEIDTRLPPLIAMIGFAMQDWSAVDPRRRRAVMLAGFALLGARFAVTTVSFVGYGQRYGRELAALDHVRPGARVMNLTEVQCDGWRSARLEHLGNLATTFRGAWVNSHWSVDGLHLLHVRYRPSPRFYNDPSEMVFPADCVGRLAERHAGYRPAETVEQVVPALPLGRLDYLWIVGVKLPPAHRDPRLRRIWSDDISELYALSR